MTAIHSGKVWAETEKPSIVAIGQPITSYEVHFMNERISVKTAQEADLVYATIQFFSRQIQDAIQYKGHIDKVKFNMARSMAKRERTGTVDWKDLK